MSNKHLQVIIDTIVSLVIGNVQWAFTISYQSWNVLNFSLQDIIVILSVLLAGKDTTGKAYWRDWRVERAWQ